MRYKITYPDYPDEPAEYKWDLSDGEMERLECDEGALIEPAPNCEECGRSLDLLPNADDCSACFERNAGQVAYDTAERDYDEAMRHIRDNPDSPLKERY